MTVDVQVLRIDDTITTETHETRKRTVPHQLVDIGTTARRTDPTIAAMWSRTRPGWIWSGHATTAQAQTLARAECRTTT